MGNMDQQILKAIQWVFLLLLANTCLLTLGIGIGLVILVAGFNARRTLLNILSTIRDMLRQCQMYLAMGKQYSESARIHQSQTAQAMEEMQHAARVAPQIVQAVERVPEVTAIKVIDKLKSGDSGSFPGTT